MREKAREEVTREPEKILMRVSFDKAQYRPGDGIGINVDWAPGSEGEPAGGRYAHCRLEVRVFRLERQVGRISQYFELEWGRPASSVFSWTVPSSELEVDVRVGSADDEGGSGRFVIGFGVEAEIWDVEDFFANDADDADIADDGGDRDESTDGGGGEEEAGEQEPRGGRAPLGRGHGAFDVATSWDVAPRYGFVTDFAPPENEEAREAVEAGEDERWRRMNDLHLNVIQFYDWMYRHHELLPPAPGTGGGEAADTGAGAEEEADADVDADVFRDPLGRELSLFSVKRQTFLARLYGMVPLGYAAVYGAEKEFLLADGRESWQAYMRDGRPFDLGQFIFIMDISGRTPWLEHLMGELEKARSAVEFEGFHLDQYGYPKSYFLKGQRLGAEPGTVAPAGPPVDMARGFVGVIRAARERLGPQAGIIFNCVNNWPVELVAREPQNVVYIEVWPPHEHYQDLRRLILRARELASSERKQVILAAYIAPLKRAGEGDVEAEEALFLATAAIMGNGGFHLVLGEGASALTDAYYPLYQRLSARAAAWVQSAWDFSVRYAELLYDFILQDTSEYVAGGVNTDLRLKPAGDDAGSSGAGPSPEGESGFAFGPMARADSVWTIVREKPGLKVLTLVNLTSVQDTRWNVPKKTPRFLENIAFEWLINEEVEGVWWAAPEDDGGRARELAWRRVPHEHGKAVAAVIPRLGRWGLVWVRLRSQE